MDKLIEKPSVNCYDFIKERKWLFILVGYGESRTHLYNIYLMLIMIILIFPGVMAIYGAYEIAPNKELMVDALHVMINTTFGVWGILTRLLTEKSIKETRNMLNAGFFHYDDEDLDEEEEKIRDGVVEDIRKRLRVFLFIFLTTSGLSTTYFPISQMMLVSDEEYERMVDIANPYLPHFFHLPFSTRPAEGLAGAFILILFFHFYVYGSAAVMFIFTFSCAKQLEKQLEILNHSIRNIQKRALSMYKKKFKINQKNISQEDLFEDKLFQKCVTNCLRSNVQHHQILLRFSEEIHPFNGSSFLLLVFVASISFAALLALLLENPPVNFIIVYLSMLLSEQTFTLYMCNIGENVMDESGKVYESLYATQWFNYNKSFNRVLGVFMCYTRKPMRLRAMLLDFTSSLETYGNFVTVMYKLLNVLREKDEL